MTGEFPPSPTNRPAGRRLFLAGLAAALASPALARAPATSPRPAPRPDRGSPAAARAGVAAAGDLVAAANLPGAVGFVLADMRSGNVIEAREAGRALPPASAIKAVTALYALEALGPRYRFATRVLTTGPVSDGEVQGDLVLQGGGDPTLDTDGLATLVAQLRAAGIRGVRGRFLVDDQALPFARSIDPSQPDHVGYNPAVSGLNLNFNRIHFEWRAQGGGHVLSLDARSQRLRPEVRMVEIRAADRGAPVYTFSEEGGRERWTVARGALSGSGSRWLPVRAPALYAGEVFQAIGASQGLRLPGPQRARGPVRGTEVTRLDSAETGALLRDMLRWSTNLTAETTGLAATLRRGVPVSGLADSAGAMGAWLGARLDGAEGMRLVDHSGLGDRARMTPEQMVRALVQAGWEGPLRPLLRDAVLRDDRGEILRNYPATVVAKTGTLNFVSTLAGYIAPPNGRAMAFAIFTGDVERRNRLGEAARERPEGARNWAQRSRILQSALVRRWVAAYGT